VHQSSTSVYKTNFVETRQALGQTDGRILRRALLGRFREVDLRENIKQHTCIESVLKIRHDKQKNNHSHYTYFVSN